MSYDNLSRPELEAKVWATITTRIAVKALLKPSIYRMAEDLFDENMNPHDKETLDEVADKHGGDLAKAYFNFLEDQGFLSWDEKGRPVIGNDLNISKLSDEELRQVLDDIDTGKYDHFFSDPSEVNNSFE